MTFAGADGTNIGTLATGRSGDSDVNRKERRQAANQGAPAPGAGGAADPGALLREGLAHHQRGDLAAAQRAYRRVLQIQPRNADALHLMGMIAYQVGELATARDLIERAIKARPSSPAYHNNMGEVRRALNELDAAVASYRRAIELDPASPGPGVNLVAALIDAGRADEALREATAMAERHPNAAEVQNSLGNACLAADDPVTAADQFARAAELAPEVPEPRFNLGNALHRQGRTDEAVEAYLAAVALRPGYAEARTNLGSAYVELGRPEAALPHLAAAVEAAPDLPEAYFGLGDALAATGRLEEAAEAYAAAVERDPEFDAARFNFAATLLDLGRPDEAEATLDELLAREPEQAHALNLWGVAAAEQGRIDDAVERYRRAAEADPSYAEPATNLGHALAERGEEAEARDWYATARDLDPGSGGLALAAATLLPAVIDSAEAAAEARAGFERALVAFMDAGLTLDDPLHALPTPAPRLLGHGENDRPLLEMLANAVSAACPALGYTAPHALEPPRDPDAGPLRVGFVLARPDDHPAARLHRGLIAGLDRERFEVTLFQTSPGDPAAAEAADLTIDLPSDLDAMAEAVAAHELDILHFPEVGAEPVATCLAFARLAPIQCAGWGNPVTSGIATVDHFLSAADLEEGDPTDHYTEAPVLLDVPAVTPERPEIAAVDRARLGLGDEDTVYLCPQRVDALHPDLDPLLHGVLAGDPHGVAVLVEPSHPRLRERLTARLERAMPAEAKRVRFLPGATHAQMLALLPAADVVLDPPHVSAFAALDALALGIPVVTMPGAFLRGRLVHAWYRRLGVGDWTAVGAEDYIAKALALGTDPAAREAARAGIAAAAPALHDGAGVRALEGWLLAAARAAR